MVLSTGNYVTIYEIHHPYMHVYTAIPSIAMQQYHKYNSQLSAKTFHSDLFPADVFGNFSSRLSVINIGHLVALQYMVTSCK